MLKISLVVLFLTTMAALTAAASALPVPPDGVKSASTLVATLG